MNAGPGKSSFDKAVGTKMDARNQWNAAEKVMGDFCEMTISCGVTLSGHFFDALCI
jgi:hypothetical protein